MAKKQRQPFRVGLLGESPNDTKAMIALLKPRYGKQVDFFILLDHITGDMLEAAETFRNLHKECEFEKPDLVLIIRDLDGLETKGPKWRLRQAYFRKVATAVGKKKSLPLLHIYKIEALICADISAFNKKFVCSCEVAVDPMAIPEPKEWLMAATAPGQPRYLEGHCAELFAKARYDTVLANCRYFAAFDREFSQRIPT